MEKLLITGGSGFVGSRIMEYYKGKYKIYAPSHQELDITDEKSVSAVMKRENPQYVIHCAAVSDTGKCEKEPELSWNINVNGCRNMAKAAKEIGAKCLICSSDQVYFGSTKMGAHDESEELSPANVYGREKLQAEKECLQVNPDCVLLRLAWMYDKECKNPKEHGDFLRTLLVKLKNKEELMYPVYDMRGITDVQEVVKNMEKAFALPGGVYNFGSPNDKSTYETVKILFEAVGIDTDLIHKNQEAFLTQPRNLTMSQEKIEQYGIKFLSTVSALINNMK